MPTPTQNETQQEFVSRRIPIVIEDGTASDADQATAVCYSMWEEREKGGNMAIEYKNFPIVDTTINDAEKGIVTHIVAVMGNIDYGSDVIHNGAFTKTLAERGNKLRVLDHHQHDSVMRVIGKPLEVGEIGREAMPIETLQRYPEITGALRVQTQYLIQTPEGLGTFERIKAQAIDEYSIGYEPITVDYSIEQMADGTKRTVRHLREIKLFEYSPVIWGMNPATSTLGVKAGRRMRGDKAELVRKIRSLLSELAAWVDYEDGEPEAEPDEEEPEKQACDTAQDQKANEAGPESVATETPPTWEAERIALLAEIETIK